MLWECFSFSETVMLVRGDGKVNGANRQTVRYRKVLDTELEVYLHPKHTTKQEIIK